MRKVKLAPAWAPLPLLAALLLGAAPISGCGAQIDRHGHVFIDVDLDQIQPGMSKEEVKTVLGSPDTKSTIGGDASTIFQPRRRPLPSSSRARSTARWWPSISTGPRPSARSPITA
ncbi:outer membrane protein assembly factor BamE domain-containing protein [Methyloceanibacter marginalis]|uniref:outer membrane protein assembly factor BamE domain-containing protein n=1 Tax=Methyloceanibacter marginalis TaxID=1774971 RepID=UPI00114CD392|nr:outer membrane protein assembly factor BamE [Methyloceanibacter marginalis]